jgi:plasmid maintenance system antidote protein VapI
MDKFIDAVSLIMKEIDKPEMKKSVLAENMAIVVEEYMNIVKEKEELIKKVIIDLKNHRNMIMR